MATRFYLPSSGAAPVSPAYNTTVWDKTDTTNGTHDRLKMVTTRISSAFTEKDISEHLDTPDTGYVLVRQYVSEALAAQTIDGTLKGVVRARQTHGAASCDLAIRVAKCASDGTGITELLAIKAEGGNAGASTTPPEFFISATPGPSDLTNRRFEETTADDFSLDLTSTGINAGDHLIVEIGYGSDANGSTTRRGILQFGDNSATDLAEDETGTLENNPWVEFSADITFGGGGGETISVDKWFQATSLPTRPARQVRPSGMTPPNRVN